jgi:hypothetical protein
MREKLKNSTNENSRPSICTPFVFGVFSRAFLPTRIFILLLSFIRSDEQNKSQRISSLSDAYSNILQSPKHAVLSTNSASKKSMNDFFREERPKLRTSDDRDERLFTRGARKNN